MLLYSETVGGKGKLGTQRGPGAPSRAAIQVREGPRMWLCPGTWPHRSLQSLRSAPSAPTPRPAGCSSGALGRWPACLLPALPAHPSGHSRRSPRFSVSTTHVSTRSGSCSPFLSHGCSAQWAPEAHRLLQTFPSLRDPTFGPRHFSTRTPASLRTPMPGRIPSTSKLPFTSFSPNS